MDNLYDLMAVWGGLDEKSLVGSRMRARTTLTPDTSGEFGTGAAMAPKFTETYSVKKVKYHISFSLHVSFVIYVWRWKFRVDVFRDEFAMVKKYL